VAAGGRKVFKPQKHADDRRGDRDQNEDYCHCRPSADNNNDEASSRGCCDLLFWQRHDDAAPAAATVSLCAQHNAFGVSTDAGCRTVFVTDACSGRERRKPALALYGDCMYELGSVNFRVIELYIDDCAVSDNDRCLS
jgi:hypothetical protein